MLVQAGLVAGCFAVAVGNPLLRQCAHFSKRSSHGWPAFPSSHCQQSLLCLWGRFANRRILIQSSTQFYKSTAQCKSRRQRNMQMTQHSAAIIYLWHHLRMPITPLSILLVCIISSLYIQVPMFFVMGPLLPGRATGKTFCPECAITIGPMASALLPHCTVVLQVLHTTPTATTSYIEVIT